ncbi:hypothetical protein V8G54_012469 [Vigna mungo]|uniref:Chromo domain-containing protein n=1 Tax=Vigna mungo TaxID=3915 RepID=A0AAQ3NUS6_VIGMU
MKKYADEKRKSFQVEIGDMVLVKLQPYRQHSVSLRKNQKLGLKYFGPFPVIAKIGVVAYKLLLPSFARIHPVFHCSQLKLCKGDHVQPYLPLPITNSELGPVLQPEAILQSRVILRNQQQVQQHLIKWEDLADTHATWEDTAALAQAFPTFNLEDKVSFIGEGNVTRIIAEEIKEENSGTKAMKNVTNDQGVRRSTRPKITNSKLADFVWSKKLI